MNTEQFPQALPPPRVEQIQDELAAARDRLVELESRARTMIRQRPVVALLAAAGFGYLVARVFSRASRGAR